MGLKKKMVKMSKVSRVKDLEIVAVYLRLNDLNEPRRVLFIGNLELSV